MKTALYGRIVFGASAVLFGVIALMWYDSDTWQTLRQIWSLPFGTIIGGCLMIVQIAGGIGMQYPRAARLASIVLGVIYRSRLNAMARYRWNQRTSLTLRAPVELQP